MSLAAGKPAFKNSLKTILTTIAANQDEGKTTTIDEYVDGLADALETWITANAIVLPGTFSNSGGPVVGAGSIQ